MRSYEKIIKVLFVCHGNICRSPMAEFVMKDLVKKASLEDRFEIASAATSSEEIWGGRGNPDGKISMLLDHCGRSGQEVADPWYTDDFDATWDDVLQGCTALLGILTGKK